MTDASIEQTALEQRATDPRLEIAATTETPQTPAVTETTDEPVDQTPVAEPTTDQESPAKPKRTVEEVLKGRVGHLTKTISAKDQELAAAQARAEAAEALLAASRQQQDPADSSAPAIRPPNAPAAYSQAEFEAAVAARTEAQEFNRKADEMYSNGASRFQDWKDSVDTLVASGFMNKDLLDTAMVVEDGTAVLHHLGVNLDEAERIAALPPIRKAAEMAKLSAVLAAPKALPVSSAPAPIRPVSGSASPQVDLQRIADDNNMSAYAAARAKMGSRWANGRK